MCGRLVCDTFLTSQDLVNCKSYNLNDMAFSELGIVKETLTRTMMDEYAKQDILEQELARHGAFDAYLVLAIAVKLKVIPLTLKLTNLAGNLWARSMYGARTERNEYLLLHAFYNANYILPDRAGCSSKPTKPLLSESKVDPDASKKDNPKENTTSFVGGLVLEPEVGFYDDYVILLDFNSLYPSIIEEFNVCFTTMDLASINAMVIHANVLFINSIYLFLYVIV